MYRNEFQMYGSDTYADVFPFKFVRIKHVATNGTMSTVELDERLGQTKIITFNKKLMNSKYELLIAYFDNDIEFLSSVLIECKNISIHKISI